MPIAHALRRLAAGAILCGMLPAPIAARVLDVGPHHALRMPSQAAALAKAGDAIRIEPGEYTDCAVWRAAKLTIEASGDGATLTGRSCQGKGIFIIQGDDTPVRNLTFARAAV